MWFPTRDHYVSIKFNSGEALYSSQLTSRTARSKGPVTKAAQSGHRDSEYRVTFTSFPLVSRTVAKSKRKTPFIIIEVILPPMKAIFTE